MKQSPIDSMLVVHSATNHILLADSLGQQTISYFDQACMTFQTLRDTTLT